MVNLDEIIKVGKTKLVACRVPEKYVEALQKTGITVTEFVNQAFKETFEKQIKGGQDV